VILEESVRSFWVSWEFSCSLSLSIHSSSKPLKFCSLRKRRRTTCFSTARNTKRRRIKESTAGWIQTSYQKMLKRSLTLTSIFILIFGLRSGSFSKTSLQRGSPTARANAWVWWLVRHPICKRFTTMDRRN
jgi:hypothetical protein